MRFSISRLVVASLGVLILAGCAGKLELFRLESADVQDPGRPDSLVLRENPGQRAESEGRILKSSGSTPRYSLRKTLQVAPDGATWAFTLTAPDRPLRIELFDDAGTVVASRSLRIPQTVDGAVVLVAVPGPTAVKSFAVRLDEEVGALAYTDAPAPNNRDEVSDLGPADHGSEAGPATLDGARLVGVAAAPPSGVPASGVTSLDGVLVVGTGATVTAWNSPDELRTWSVTPEGSSWGASTPVEVVYRNTAAIAPRADTSPASAEIEVGPAALSLSLRPGEHRAVVYPSVYGVGNTQFTLTATEPNVEVVRIGPVTGGDDAAGDAVPGATIDGAGAAESVGGTGVAVPLPADLGTVRDYPWELWRNPNHEVFRWTLFPHVLIFDTRDYAVQARFFKRLAFFVEKEGFVGQILSDEQLAGRHGYNAHNYNGEGLAAFFSAAERSGVQLTAEERELRMLLLNEGIIVARGAGYGAGEGGVLSISQESWRFPGLRDLLLTHEAFHGVYYSSPEYVERIRALWRSLNDAQRRYWLLFLDGMQYDVNDEYLVENEFQAYLLQQPVNGATWYFEGRGADRLRSWKPQEVDWINGFLAGNTGTFRAQAAAANEILFSETGLVAGDVYCLRPLSP